jgi:hypothetical protein
MFANVKGRILGVNVVLHIFGPLLFTKRKTQKSRLLCLVVKQIYTKFTPLLIKFETEAWFVFVEQFEDIGVIDEL